MLEKNYEKEELIDIIDNNINNKINDIQEIKKTICEFKDNLENELKGIGFFVKVPYKDKYIRALLTCNHIKAIEDNNDEINFFIEKNKKNLLLKEGRTKFQSDKKNLNYTCIQILKEDKINKFFKIDKKILNDNYSLEGRKPIKILNKNLGISNIDLIDEGDKEKINNIENNFIYFKYTNEVGYSGCPILDKENLVIGIHKGSENFDDNKKINSGVLLKYIIKDIFDEIDKYDENKKKL